MISKAIPINLVGDRTFVPKSIKIYPIIARNFTQSHIFIHSNLIGGHLLKGLLISVRFTISEPRFSQINQSNINIFHLSNCMFWLVDNTRCKFRHSPKSLRSILWAPWMTAPDFISWQSIQYLLRHAGYITNHPKPNSGTRGKIRGGRLNLQEIMNIQTEFSGCLTDNTSWENTPVLWAENGTNH